MRVNHKRTVSPKTTLCEMESRRSDSRAKENVSKTTRILERIVFLVAGQLVKRSPLQWRQNLRVQKVHLACTCFESLVHDVAFNWRNLILYTCTQVKS